MHRGPSLLSSTDSEHLVLGVWLTGPDADVCVCTECVWLTGPDADVCVCTECVWLTGPDADVCLSRVGHCQRTSAKHAVIFYDQVSCLSSLSLSLSLSLFPQWLLTWIGQPGKVRELQVVTEKSEETVIRFCRPARTNTSNDGMGV